MIELIIVYLMCKKMGASARRKGLPPLLFQFLTFILWFGGQVAGIVLGISMFGELGLAAYGMGLGCAVGGVILAFICVALVPRGRSD